MTGITITDLIAFFALIVSVLLFIVHYRNQVERRHGEISKLRSDLVHRMSDISHRARSTQMHLETARLELRRLPDSDDKYGGIEQMPGLIEDQQTNVGKIAGIQRRLESLDSSKANTGKVLMMLQSIDHDVRVVTDWGGEVEEKTLGLLKLMRSKIEGPGAQQDRSGDA